MFFVVEYSENRPLVDQHVKAYSNLGLTTFFEIIKIKRGIRTLFCQHENFIVSKMRKCGYFVLISYNRKPKSDFI